MSARSRHLAGRSDGNMGQTQIAMRETHSDSPILPVNEIVLASNKLGKDHPLLKEMWEYYKSATTEESLHRRAKESEALSAEIADAKRGDSYALIAFVLSFLAILIILLAIILVSFYTAIPWQAYFAIASAGAGVPYFLKMVLKSPGKHKKEESASRK